MFKSSSQRTWLVAFLATIALIILSGYTFNSNDQEEHLPQVYQLINPTLFQSDYFVTAYHQTHSPRLFFVWLIYLSHFVLPVSTACFLFYLLCVTITAWSIQQVALFFSGSNLVAQCSVFAVFLLFNDYVIGGNALINPQLMCATFGTAFCSLAVYFLIKKRWTKAAIAAGVATLFQVLIGFHFMLVIVALYVLANRKKILVGTFVKNLVIYLIVSAPMLLPMIFLQTKGNAEDQALFYHILYYVRNPNHYLPSAFPHEDYFKFISLTLIAGVLHFFVDDRLKKLWRVLLFILFGGMVFYTVMLEGLKVMPIGKIQWFKVCSWAMVINVLVIVAFVVNNLVKRITLLTRFKIPSYQIVLVAFVGLLFITNSRYIPIRYFQVRYHTGNYLQSDLEKMHEWIRINTPVDCSVLTSPYDDSFLCEAQRNMPIGFKAIVHEPFFLIPWHEKFKYAYHNSQPFKELNIRRPATDHYEQFPPLPSSTLHWDYRIADLKKGKYLPESETIVHQENDYALLKVIR